MTELVGCSGNADQTQGTLGLTAKAITVICRASSQRQLPSSQALNYVKIGDVVAFVHLI
jgi:hypothetical protein